MASLELLKDKTVLELKGCVSYRRNERKKHNMHSNMSSSMCCKLQEVCWQTERCYMTNDDEQRSEVLAVESLWVQGPVHVSTAGPGSKVVRA